MQSNMRQFVKYWKEVETEQPENTAERKSSKESEASYLNIRVTKSNPREVRQN